MADSSISQSWLAVRLAPGVSRSRFYALLQRFGSPEAILGARAQEILSLRGMDEETARAILDGLKNPAIAEELQLMAEHGVRMVTRDCPDYPANLSVSSFSPPLLFVRGTLEPNDRYSVALVGSRHATQYGKAVADQIAARLAACGITVVSGFARGVDSHAHAAAMKAGGRTIAVLGNGMGTCYPSENRALAERVVQHGALVSEYPMRTAPDRFNFPERNRVIATLSLGTLVCEAAEKSGALITAREALEENRFVFAVPGDITRQNSRGTNILIQNGARLVQNAEDILMEMKGQLRGYLREELLEPTDETAALNLVDKSGGHEVAKAAVRPPTSNFVAANLNDDERYVFEMLQHEPLVFDLIASRVEPERMTVQKLSSVLLSLELKRAIRQLPGRFYAVFS